MQRRALYFNAPGQIQVRSEEMEPVRPDRLWVMTQFSAISPGTELMMYRGHFPAGLALDESIEALEGSLAYPFKYGYAAIGRVIATGDQVDPAWKGRLVFAFQPHQSHFSARADQVLPVPDGIDPLAALFLPNMETAINFLMDGSPMIGERVGVFGQGVVGLLTTALLQQFPLERLVTVDRFSLRRRFSLQLGADRSLAPEEARLEDLDLVYELSGSPDALDAAIAAAGFGGRVVIGSWYGSRPVRLDLGGHFHRSRVRLISSQVSTIAAEFGARWSKQRRYAMAWRMIADLDPQKLITRQVAFESAAEAYNLLATQPQEHVQIILRYD